MDRKKQSIFAKKYQIIKKIGQGGMGEIYKVRCLENNSIQALKIVSSTRPERSKEIYKRLKREAITISKLNHPNIIKLHDFGEYENVPYFTMEFIEGKNLHQMLHIHGKFKPQESAEILIKVADAIHYAHSNGVIHRDLSAGNIMLTKDNTPVIMDFGIAKIRDAQTKLTQDASIFGTLEYMSPERISTAYGKVTAKSDIYSMGILLFEMLTGSLPFTGEKTNIIWKACHQNLPSLRSIDKNIPRVLENLCNKSTQKKRKLRTKNALEFRNELLRYLRKPNYSKKSIRIFNQRKALLSLISIVIVLSVYFSYQNYFHKIETWQEYLEECWDGKKFDFTNIYWEKLAFHKKLEYAKKYQVWFAEKKKLPLIKKLVVKDSSFSMTLIPPGQFWMGSLEVDGHTGQRRKKATTDPFYISQYEVTIKQWQNITKKEINSDLLHFSQKCAVTHISWYDIQTMFINRLGYKCKLPTEKEWEYACRSGSNTRFYWGNEENQIQRYAWYRDNAYHRDQKHAHPVGQKIPNNWNIYDMSGNVYEWCDNLYEVKRPGYYAIRGGYWAEHPSDCQSTARHYRFRDDRDDDVGFRFIKIIE